MNLRIVVTSSLLALAALLASCGGAGDEAARTVTETQTASPDTAPPEPAEAPTTVIEQAEPVLVLVESGGCYQVGPLCRTLTFFVDGTATVDWPAEADQPQQRYALDPELITRWIDVVVSSDIDAMVRDLPAGSCQGCVDGVDHLMTIDVGGVQAALDSMEVEFVSSEPVFALAFEVARAIPWEPPASVTEGY